MDKLKDDYFAILMKIHSIAKIGLLYSHDPYALENYEEIQQLTKDALESFLNLDFKRPSFFSRDVYPTPNLSVRTFIFNEQNEILLVQESDSGKWSLPGGWIDLYDSPSTAAKKECLQEAGAVVDIMRLVGIADLTAINGSKSSEFVIVFEGRLLSLKNEHCHETTDVRFFPLSQLPAFSNKMYKKTMERFLKAIEDHVTIFD